MQTRLIKALQKNSPYPHTVAGVELVQTHISWLFLTGEFAYKVKKAVNFEFLDFSTLAKRKYYCEEELRLNRRFSNDLYLGVVPITGSVDFPRVGGSGKAIEYAVKMKEFRQDALLSHVVRQGEISEQQLQQLAYNLAHFHLRASSANTLLQSNLDGGLPKVIADTVRENFNQVKKTSLQKAQGCEAILKHLSTWSALQLKQLELVFAARHKQGFVRECHGDLHLDNIAIINDRITFFDCIEFSPQLRWIDVISELAFLLMDLEYYGHANYANYLLNCYLEITGDYSGLKVLTFYKVYRAMVRIKVNALRMEQEDISVAEKANAKSKCLHSLYLAETYTRNSASFLAITHGVSGSGKTSVSNKLVESCRAIRLRSDVERKRLHGLGSQDKTESSVDLGIYDVKTTELTYEHLATHTRTLLTAGLSVVVDATFLSSEQRHKFFLIAQEYQVPIVILDCQAEESVLVQRLLVRAKSGRGASEADENVLRKQLARREPLSAAESQYALTIDTDRGFTSEQFQVLIENCCQENIESYRAEREKIRKK